MRNKIVGLILAIGIIATIAAAPAAAAPRNQQVVNFPRSVVWGHVNQNAVLVYWTTCDDPMITHLGSAANVVDGSCAVVHVNGPDLSFNATYVGEWQDANNGTFLFMEGLGFVNGGKTHWSLIIRKHGWRSEAELHLGQSFDNMPEAFSGPFYGVVFLPRN